ncbi:hypothetical protein PVAG01_05911 [Phlyctema vagabunda]|uniref:Uncharacterized protein n=1 Tax=Phlyctema vagabunda TaxID=108571 RepID=A0ABR4PEL1_9HELO
MSSPSTNPNSSSKKNTAAPATHAGSPSGSVSSMTVEPSDNGNEEETIDFTNLPAPESLLLLGKKERKAYVTARDRIYALIELTARRFPGSTSIFPIGTRQKTLVWEEMRAQTLCRNGTVRSWDQGNCHARTDIKELLVLNETRDAAFNSQPRSLLSVTSGEGRDRVRITGIVVDIESFEVDVSREKRRRAAA